MAGKRVKVSGVKRHPDAPVRGQAGLGVIPPGVKVRWPAQGNLVFSSMLSGHDHESPEHELPATAEREVALLFDHIRRFVESAGGTIEDLENVTLFTMDDGYRGLIEQEWANLFGGVRNEPAHHVVNVAPSGLRHERVEAVVVARVA